MYSTCMVVTIIQKEILKRRFERKDRTTRVKDGGEDGNGGEDGDGDGATHTYC